MAVTSTQQPPGPKLKPDAANILQTALAASGLPGTLAIATADEVLFSGAAGPFDPLEEHGPRPLSDQDVMWFASTTKLLTSICYLTLVDKGVVTLDTDMRKLFPPLDAAALHVLEGFNDDGTPVLVANDKPVTLASLLNQTSGFGMEFGEKVQRWKKVAEKGTGFVNSCKVDNLIHTPLCFVPGTSYEYGNSAEWLGLMLPHITGISMEEYLQANVLRPLGLKNTTFYPFGEAWEGRLMPLRFRTETGTFEVLKDQLPLLTLPRSKDEIEYPVSGGGIYSTSADYVLILQHLLAHYTALQTGSPRPAHAILSDASLRSLFEPSVPEAALAPLADMMSYVLGGEFAPGDADWTTGMALYQPKDGRRRACGDGKLGRHARSVGWGGAAGTQYWICPTLRIAVVLSTQVLPGTGPATAMFKDAVEAAVYEALEL